MSGEKPQETVEEKKEDDMFGEKAPEEQLPQDVQDLTKYNEMMAQYERHLLQREDEQKNAQDGLKKMASEYRADWKAKDEKDAEKALEDQKKEWEQTQGMLTDDKVGSWAKIGQLVGKGEGRVFEVLEAKIADEAEEEKEPEK